MLQTLKTFAQGRKTIWVARFYVVAGLAVAIKDVLDAQGFDVSAHLPASLTHTAWWPYVLIGTGLLFEGLRRITVTAPSVSQGPTNGPTQS